MRDRSSRAEPSVRACVVQYPQLREAIRRRRLRVHFPSDTHNNKFTDRWVVPPGPELPVAWPSSSSLHCVRIKLQRWSSSSQCGSWCLVYSYCTRTVRTRSWWQREQGTELGDVGNGAVGNGGCIFVFWRDVGIGRAWGHGRGSGRTQDLFTRSVGYLRMRTGGRHLLGCADVRVNEGAGLGR